MNAQTKAARENGKSDKIPAYLEKAGANISRYGLVVILALIGVLKFTPAEADGIQPLVAHSPFLSWMYLLLGKQGVSNVIGTIELLGASFWTGAEAWRAFPGKTVWREA